MNARSISKTKRVLFAGGLMSGQARGHYAGIRRHLLGRSAHWSLVFNPACFFRPVTEDLLRHEISRGLDGIILGAGTTQSMIDDSVRAGLKTVIVDPADAYEVPPSVVSVAVDEKAIAECLKGIVSPAGTYAEVAFVKDLRDLPWMRRRGEAVMDMLRGIGIACRSITLPGDAAALLSLAKPALVIAANDCTAYQVAEECGAAGIRIPQEIALAGIDNDGIICSLSSPSLTSVAIDWEEGGMMVAKKMDALLAGRRTARFSSYASPRLVLRQSTRASSPAGRLVIRADEIIRVRARTPLTVQELADELRVSKRLLTERYRQIKHTTVLGAIHEVRLKEVTKLLRNTPYAIEDIARECQFADLSQLRKLFKRTYGQSMTEWRRSQN